MSKAVLISIRPQWCEKIASGDKTIEVRKTRPKMDTPFKCYIYCTQGDDKHRLCGSRGKVIGEFTCDRIYELETKARGGSYYVKGEDWLTACEVAQQSCLSLKDMHGYLHAQKGYGWHITDLRIYDAPRELSEFCRATDPCDSCRAEYTWECEGCEKLSGDIKRPPQSWCYVEEM